MARVSLTASARRDIKKISTGLAEQGGIGPAIAFSDSIVALRSRLERFPEAYAVRPALGAAIRAAVVYPHLVLYRYDAEYDRTIILRVLHGHRNITADFMKMR